MDKMHLAARPANEGARVLAWYIGSEHGGDVGRAADKIGIDRVTVQRLLEGELVPGADLAQRLCAAVGSVTLRNVYTPRSTMFWRLDRRAWRRDPLGPWGRPPEGFRVQKRGQRRAA